MIKTPLSTAIGGAGIWTPGCTVLGGQQNINQLIKSLFADGTQGLYINAQDSASIADLSSIKDLSGNNNHALQANSTSRASSITDPSGYKSLKFDGVDDGYVTQSIDFSNTDKVTVIAAVRKLSDVTSAIIIEHGVVGVNNKAFTVSAPDGNNLANYSASLRNTSRATVFLSNKASPRSSILTVKLNYIGATITDQVKIIENATPASPLTDGSLLTATNFNNAPIYIGRRGGTSLPFNGQIYALLVIGKLLDDATTQRIEKEFAKYIGVTL